MNQYNYNKYTNNNISNFSKKVDKDSQDNKLLNDKNKVNFMNVAISSINNKDQ